MADLAKVLNGGLGLLTSLIKVAAVAEPHHIGWGTGTTAVDVADTGLETAAAESRVVGTSTIETTNTTNDTYKVVGTITCAGAGKTISEVALYNDATAGTCYIRGTFTGIPLSVGDAITFSILNPHDQA